VLEILEKRSADEARIILKRHQEDPLLLFTDISDRLSSEINALYAQIFRLFESRPQLCQQPLFRKAILNHLPRMIREEPRYRQRTGKLPQKYISAILAAEIGSSLVYEGQRESALEDTIRLHLMRKQQ
jgi:glutamate dehydrogenase